MAALPSTAAHGRTMRAPLAAESCSRCGAVWPPVERIFPRGPRVQLPTPGSNAFWSWNLYLYIMYVCTMYIVPQCFGSGSVLDPFQDLWILLRPKIRTEKEKNWNFMFWRARCSHWRAEGFSWSLEDPHGGLSGFDDYVSETPATNKILDKLNKRFESWNMDTVNVCADSFDIRFIVHVLDYN
jgi:hypothetical protein